ncbi:hypothetical protein U1T56_16315 [Geminicoccaceae bacterium SYSU G07066]|uniref:Uncharacterized protein n=1 Tax=Benzoatithermus flavus TaxID=3108223 RepID=A0ABU8XWH0_9PROT
MRIFKIVAVSLVVGLGFVGMADAGQKHSASSNAKASASGGRLSGAVTSTTAQTGSHRSASGALSTSFNERSLSLGIGQAEALGQNTRTSTSTTSKVSGGWSSSTSSSSASSSSN